MNDEKKALQMNENMTVILAKEGQPDALRQIYQQHGGRIYRLAFSHTGSKPDAEDIMAWKPGYPRLFGGMERVGYGGVSCRTICDRPCFCISSGTGIVPWRARGSQLS